MKVIKRDKREVEYSKGNIKEAIMKATFDVTKDEIKSDSIASEILAVTDIMINERFKKPTVEEIQDLIEQNLMVHKHYDVAKAYILYREKQKMKREGSWLTGELSNSIWENKYRYGNETPEEFLRRVTKDDKNIAKLIRNKLFCPAGRILANRQLQNDGKKVSYSNCYVNISPEDNIESIFKTASQLARTFSYGGGSGVDISKLRPNSAKVNNAANTTSGACSFMRLYDITSSIIGQKGRRAALLISMLVSHTDIEEFIDIKNNLDIVTKANISIRITDDFMEAVKKDKDFELSFYVKDTGEQIKKTVSAMRIFNKIAYSNWRMAEPGMLLWNKIESWCIPSEDKTFKYGGVNPCVVGNTLVSTPNGCKKVEDFKKGDEILTVDGKGKVDKIYKYNKKPVYKIIFSDGGELICTAPHQLQTKSNGVYKSIEVYNIKSNQFIRKYKAKDVKVKSIKPYGNSDVYDLHEPTSDTWITNGYVSRGCGEEPLPEGGSCNLASINLSEFVVNQFEQDAYFDMEHFKDIVGSGIRYLNEILDEGLRLHPLHEQRESVRQWRQIGLGIMGLADMFIKMGIIYGDKRSINLSKKIGHSMINTALQQSALLAKEYGPYPKYHSEDILKSKFIKKNADGKTYELILKYGLRNSQLLTIAPSGTISNLFGTSGGVEPIFALSYKRKTKTLHDTEHEYDIFTPIVREYMEKNGIDNVEDLPEYFVTSHDIPYRNRIDLQSAWQQYIDAAISSTVNLPNSATIDDIKKLYMYAWEKGTKGITIYRDGCAREGILTHSNSDGKVKEMTDDDFISLNICPVCKNNLKRVGGCAECPNCGFSVCG